MYGLAFLNLGCRVLACEHLVLYTFWGFVFQAVLEFGVLVLELV